MAVANAASRNVWLPEGVYESIKKQSALVVGLSPIDALARPEGRWEKGGEAG